MYQRSETLGVGVGNMVDKGNWMLNAANLLRTGSEDGYKRAMNSVFGSVQMAWKEYLSLDLTARNDWSSTLPSGNNSFLLSVCQPQFRSVGLLALYRQTVAKLGDICQGTSVCRTGR